VTTPLDYLYSLEHFGIKFGLDNIRTILESLGHPEDAFRSVHIAGTNGKGSVTAMIEAALRAAGHRSARYTSPHLVDLTERFMVDGQAAPEEELSRAVGRVRDAILGLQSIGRLDVHPTFFEVTTAAAFEIFRAASVEVAVVEVGLGGRLDATNVLSPLVTAITSIGFDHQQYLGTSLAEIAAEKAGIIKPGVPVVVGRVDAEASRVIREIARERSAPLIEAHDGVRVDLIAGSRPDGQTIRLATPLRDYGIVDLGLAGTHQIDNALVAVRVLESLAAAGLNVPHEAIVTGLRTVQWPGRLERIRLTDGRSVLLDAAHNPAGAVALGAFLRQRGDRPPLVFAVMRDKDVRGILAALAPHIGGLVLTRASNPRSADPHHLAEIASTIMNDVAIIIEEPVGNALVRAWKLSPEIVVAGSIFLLGDVLNELRRT
jgi:dihydrofolate synthase/folylpolyglutamate synthase